MSKLGVRVIVLGEDEEHRRFVYHVLLCCGCHRRDIYVAPSSEGRGAAEQWVRSAYPHQVSAHRSKAAYQDVGLFVVLDVDRETVQRRQKQLADSLKLAKERPRGADERIVHLLPKRHIETWIAHLLRLPVNEEDDFKQQARDVDFRVVARRFLDIHRASVKPNDLPPSLAASFEEFGRFSRM